MTRYLIPSKRESRACYKVSIRRAGATRASNPCSSVQLVLTSRKVPLALSLEIQLIKFLRPRIISTSRQNKSPNAKFFVINLTAQCRENFNLHNRNSSFSQLIKHSVVKLTRANSRQYLVKSLRTRTRSGTFLPKSVLEASH